MIYTIDRIVEDVRVCMDQNRTSDALFAEDDSESLILDEVIKSKILEAVRIVHLAAPYYLLEQGHNFGDDEEDGEVAISWESGNMFNCGYVKLPDDFLRLVVFEMDDWERPVYDAILTSDPVYAKQRSRIAGIRGTSQRPVCAIGVKSYGRVLEFYSCKSRQATVKQAVYIPMPVIDTDGGVDISKMCYRSVVYMIAGLTLQTTGEKERGNIMTETSIKILQ